MGLLNAEANQPKKPAWWSQLATGEDNRPDVIICCLLADHVSLGSILPTAAPSFRSLSAGIAPAPSPELLLVPPTLETALISGVWWMQSTQSSLTFQTAALPFLVNASCPFSGVPDQTKTQVSTPSQSCAPGLADLCTTQQAQTRPLRDNLGKNKQQLTSKQLCYTWCCNFCCNDKCSKLTDVRHLKITLAFKYNGIFKVRLLECFSFNCPSHQGALRSHFHAFIGK